MEQDSFSYFNTDNKCYDPKWELNDSNKLNEFIDDKFDTYKYEIRDEKNQINKCKLKAIEKNKKFFLISDLSRNRLGSNLTYNCLIPKVDKLCSSNNINDLLRPFNDLINDLFSTNDSRIIIGSEGNELTNNEKLKRTNFNEIPKCGYLKDQDGNRQYLPKTGTFVMYKTDLIDNNNIKNQLSNIQDYDYHYNEYDKWNQRTSGILDSLKIDYKNYICNSDNREKEKKLDESITVLKQQYDTIFQSMDNLMLDISNITLLTKHDTLYLEKLQRMIDDKENKLKNLIGFDGANNGKLSDTRFLKNMKISENIILILVIMLVIFAYCKKKL
tara:strand:+ start:2208 stop:3194 length:987 start_codon:yes stop_codon:yes gene_type:complete